MNYLRITTCRYVNSFSLFILVVGFPFTENFKSKNAKSDNYIVKFLFEDISGSPQKNG